MFSCFFLTWHLCQYYCYLGKLLARRTKWFLEMVYSRFGSIVSSLAFGCLNAYYWTKSITNINLCILGVVFGTVEVWGQFTCWKFWSLASQFWHCLNIQKLWGVIQVLYLVCHFTRCWGDVIKLESWGNIWAVLGATLMSVLPTEYGVRIILFNKNWQLLILFQKYLFSERILFLDESLLTLLFVVQHPNS